MDFLKLAKQRYSVRSFENKPVEQEKLDQILEAGRVAPTAANLQPQKILVIRTKKNLEKLKKCTHFHFEAPLVLLICEDTSKAWERKYDKKRHGEIDASIVTTHMMLEAFSIGIGSTWVCSFDPERIKKEFNIPNKYEPIHLLPMGYPAKEAVPSKNHDTRYPIEETVFYEEF